MPFKIRVLLRDLQRRRVIRVAALYLVAAWIAVEVSATTFPLLGLPPWTPTLVLALLGVGFPVALALAWAYDIGPEGVTRTSAGDVTPPDSPGVGEAAESPPRSVAILPFADLSADGDQEYLGDGIAEEILNVLGQIEGLQVTARTSSFAFKGRNEDVREIGRRLGVEAVLEGSVRTAGERLRVSAQLIGVGDGYHLWTRRFDCDLGDIFAVQDEIAAEIAAALNVREPAVIPSERAGTDSLQAYEHYLRGRRFFHLHTQRGLRVAEQMFRRALEADPEYALAHAGLAETCSFLYMYHEASEKHLRCADEHSRRALDHGPEVAEAHVSRGLALSLSKRFDEATETFDRAVELNPRSFEAHYLHARSRFAAGDLDGAAALFRQAAEIRPEAYDAWGLLASLLQGMERPEEMRDAARRAVDAARRALDASPDDVRALYMGAGAMLLMGERERAVEWADRAAATDPDEVSVHYNLACFYMNADMEDRALHHLERAVDLGFAHREWIENDPDLAPLREHGRYRSILARLDAASNRERT